MFDTAQSDPGEFRAIVEVLLHRLKWSSAEQVSRGAKREGESGGSSGESMSPDAAPQLALSDRLSGGCKVWVRTAAVREPRGSSASSLVDSGMCPVEVLCPHISLVRWHSSRLADDITELMKHWQGLPDIKNKLSKAGTIPAEFRVLEGEFEIWQEVF